MKLIDLLVKELPSRGGWPEGIEYCWQDHDKEIRFAQGSQSNFYPSELCDLYRTLNERNPEPGSIRSVTREQYETAIAQVDNLENPYRKTAPVHPAHSFLEKGVQHMKDRAAQRDSEYGERSMKACVDAFNAMFGHDLTETQGWQFMVLLKMARSRNKFNPDDYEDGAAYTGLAGEAHSHEQK